MIGRPYRIILNSFALGKRKGEARDLLRARYKSLKVLMRFDLNPKVLVMEVNTSCPEETGSKILAAEIQAELSRMMDENKPVG